jgi:RarD protein
MCIFSTIGIVRKYIPLASSIVALARAVIGAIFLLVVIGFRKKPVRMPAGRKNMILLLVSGFALGMNWILLFESYNYTSVATATLCYYLAPILVILASPLVLGEKLTLRKGICAAAALVGMVLVSGVTDGTQGGLQDWKGILFGLGAAVLYACVVLLNRKIDPMDAFDKTFAQLAIAAVTLLPYVFLTEELSALQITPDGWILLATAGIVHTGIAYSLYFKSISHLPAQTSALLSYIDPIFAVLLSVLVLKESMSVAAFIGAAMILGAAIVSEQKG